MEDYLRIGVITTAHGVKGEVKVFPTTDDVKRYKKLKSLYLSHKNAVKELKVESVKFFKQFVILKLDGINDMDTAMLYRNADLLVSRKDAVKCEKDEYFIADLIGLEVLCDDGRKIGVLKEVFPTGANDVYEVEREDGTDLLIPAIKECILEVNIKEGFVKVKLLEGL
jgi:16S rRNA processing protein RimM